MGRHPNQCHQCLKSERGGRSDRGSYQRSSCTSCVVWISSQLCLECRISDISIEQLPRYSKRIIRYPSTIISWPQYTIDSNPSFTSLSGKIDLSNFKLPVKRPAKRPMTPVLENVAESVATYPKRQGGFVSLIQPSGP